MIFMNELYKKMILALPSNFFENWEWKAGDKAFSLKREKELMVVEFDVWSDPRIIHAKFIGEVGYTYLENLETLRPLPNQKQLQSLAIRKESDSSNVFILIEFTAYVKERGYKWYKNKSMECLWLEFLMDTKHHFDWKKDKWVKRGE